MLRFHKDGLLRIAIPTGSLRRADWGAPPPTCGQLLAGTAGSLDNFVFIVDLPLQDQLHEDRVQHESLFQRELLRYLAAAKTPADIYDRVMQYDFTAYIHLSNSYRQGPYPSLPKQP
jgi:hypothetical protein